MKFIRLCTWCLWCAPFYVQALVLDDFAPSLVNSNSQIESQNTASLIKYNLVESHSLSYTAKSVESTCDKVNNASCLKPTSSTVLSRGVKPPTVAVQPPVVGLANQGANDQYFNRNGNNFDQNAVNNFNITNSNQTTMQAYSAELNNLTIEDKLKQNIAIPLSTGSNSAVSVGTNNVQFNVSY